MTTSEKAIAAAVDRIRTRILREVRNERSIDGTIKMEICYWLDELVKEIRNPP